MFDPRLLRNSILSAAFVVAVSAMPAFAQDDAEDDKPPQRAMGGEAVSHDDFPWQVALVQSAASSVYQGQYCGGTLISSRWVMTAAHCFADEDSPYQAGGECGGHDVWIRANQVSVYGRSNNLEGSGVLVDARRVICHPDYDARTNHNDIALIELEGPINVAQYALLATPAQSADVEAPGRIAMVTGWGVYRIEGVGTGEGTMDSSSGPGRAFSPTILQGVEVPVISDATCAAGYDNRITVDERHICAGVINQGRDTCRGDSGGPLQVRDSDNDYVQVGIVSWGRRCESGGYYNIYTQVSNYLGWLSQVSGLDLGASDVVMTDDNDDVTDVVLPADNGVVQLSAGFTPDPYARDVSAGGSYAAVEVDDACRGYVPMRSNIALDYASGSFDLSIAVSSEQDTTLMVMLPSGAIMCSDDFEGRHPAITVEDPDTGVYQIWVGTYYSDDQSSDARLTISELGPQF